MRFEDGPEPVIVFMSDGVILVIMALGTIKSQADKGLCCMFYCSVQPGSAVKEVVVAGEKTRGPDSTRVGGGQFVSGQHFLNHAVVALVVVEGLYNPVTPTPNVLLAVSKLFIETVPIRITPDVHPVTGPALTVLGAGEEFIHNRLPCPSVMQLFVRRRQADEVEIETADENCAFWLSLHFQTELCSAFFKQDVNGVSIVSRQD